MASPQKPSLKQPPIATTKPPIFDINANRGEDPDLPYSGGSSAAFLQDEQQLNKSAETEKKKQRQQRSDLLPVAKDIFAFMEEERMAIGDIRSYLSKLPPGVSGTQVKDEYRARELYLMYLKRFEQWMINRLSKTPAKKIR